MVNVFDTISLKNMQIVILLLQLLFTRNNKKWSRLNQELDITGLPPSFYMNLPELLDGTIKKRSMFSTQFHSKTCKS